MKKTIISVNLGNGMETASIKEINVGGLGRDILITNQEARNIWEGMHLQGSPQVALHQASGRITVRHHGEDSAIMISDAETNSLHIVPLDGEMEAAIMAGAMEAMISSFSFVENEVNGIVFATCLPESLQKMASGMGEFSVKGDWGTIAVHKEMDGRANPGYDEFLQACQRYEKGLA